jgi:hypothetical protein
MIRSATGRAPKVKSLAQQNTDFTAEGSPPPGQVASTVPVTAEATGTSLPRAPAVRRRAGKPPGKGR